MLLSPQDAETRTAIAPIVANRRSETTVTTSAVPLFSAARIRSIPLLGLLQTFKITGQCATVAYLTSKVPVMLFMCICALQWYGYSPGLSKVNVNVSPFASGCGEFIGG